MFCLRSRVRLHTITTAAIAASIMSLAACGDGQASADTTATQALTQALNIHHAEVGDWLFDNIDEAQSTDDTCAEIMATIHAHRDAVAATDEWKAFEATDAWQQVKTDGIVLKRLKCKHNDPHASYACQQMVSKIKQHFATAQGTDEYKACTALKVWQELEKNYDTARENQCLPSQQASTEG